MITSYGCLGAKQNASPLILSGVKRSHTLHGSTLLAVFTKPPLVSSVTGGPGPVLPGGSGVVLPPSSVRPSHHPGLSLNGMGGFFSLNAILTREVYHSGRKMSRLILPGPNAAAGQTFSRAHLMEDSLSVSHFSSTWPPLLPT